MAITGALIAAAMLVTVQVVGWIALERKAVERRERALAEAGNLLERAIAYPWDDLTAESLKRIPISEGTTKVLRSPTIKFDLASSEDAPARKKVVVEIRWLDRSGRPEAPVRLAAWVHRQGEAAK